MTMVMVMVMVMGVICERREKRRERISWISRGWDGGVGCGGLEYTVCRCVVEGGGRGGGWEMALRLGGGKDLVRD